MTDKIEAIHKARILADQIAVNYLNKNGKRVIRSVWDLVNSEGNYDDLIPALVELLMMSLPDDGRTHEGVVRALTIKSASGKATENLVNLFKSTKNESLRWAIGNAFNTIATSEDYQALRSLWRDANFGSAREMLALALVKTKHKSVFDELVHGLHDITIQNHAVQALSRLNDPRALPFLEPFITSDKAWVRNYAKKAINKFNNKKEN